MKKINGLIKNSIKLEQKAMESLANLLDKLPEQLKEESQKLGIKNAYLRIQITGPVKALYKKGEFYSTNYGFSYFITPAGIESDRHFATNNVRQFIIDHINVASNPRKQLMYTKAWVEVGIKEFAQYGIEIKLQ